MKYVFTILVSATILFSGCKTEEDFSGPSLNDLYGQFSIIEGLSISDENVDFAAGESTFFSATFSKNVEWKLKITGLESGATNEITGFSYLLDNSNSTWTGNASVLPLFKAEECAVELSFVNEVDTLRDTLSVVSPKIYEGFILSDFENGVNSGWNSFVQTGANMSFAIEESPTSAEGLHYFNIGGTVNWDWLIGLINMPGSAYGATHYALSENPANEFFNVMLYKPEELSNGLMLFQFREDDNLDGVYTNNAEDMFSVEIAMSENGWNLYSRKYSDLATLINGQPANPLGNGVHEPHKLIEVSVLFLANPTSGYANAYIDYITFTQGAPLEP
jgi:hypothetical protein